VRPDTRAVTAAALGCGNPTLQAPIPASVMLDLGVGQLSRYDVPPAEERRGQAHHATGACPAG